MKITEMESLPSEEEIDIYSQGYDDGAAEYKDKLTTAQASWEAERGEILSKMEGLFEIVDEIFNAYDANYEEHEMPLHFPNPDPMALGLTATKKFLSTYKKQTVECEDCGGDGILLDGKGSFDECQSCQGTGTKTTWGKK